MKNERLIKYRIIVREIQSMFSQINCIFNDAEKGESDDLTFKDLEKVAINLQCDLNRFKQLLKDDSPNIGKTYIQADRFKLIAKKMRLLDV